MKIIFNQDGSGFGINCAVGAGQYAFEVSCGQLVNGMDGTLYKDVNGTVTPLSAEEISALSSQATFDAQKETDARAAREVFEVDGYIPVEVTTPEGTWTYNGGKESANDINGAVQLAEELGETEARIWDIDNVVHVLSFDSARQVAAAIALAWRTAAYIKQAALVQIAARTYTEE